MADLVHLGDIPVPDKAAIPVEAARRKGHDPVRQAQQTLGLAGEEDAAGGAVAVVQGPDADGVPGGHEAAGGGVVEDEGELRVQLVKHVLSVLTPQGQQQLAVGAAGEGIALRLQLPFHLTKAVELAVADHGAAVRGGKGLHPLRVQAHDGQPVEEETSARQSQGAAAVGSPALGRGEGVLQPGQGDIGGGITHDCAHKKHLQMLPASLKYNFRTNRRNPWCHLICR